MSFVYEENECSLVVLSAGAQDGGVYTCTARNLAGEVSCKAELAVQSGGLELKGSNAECSPRDPMMWAPNREAFAQPFTLDHPLLQPQLQHLCFSFVPSICPAQMNLCPIPCLVLPT